VIEVPACSRRSLLAVTAVNLIWLTVCSREVRPGRFESENVLM
jgi:hypothetical protein